MKGSAERNVCVQEALVANQPTHLRSSFVGCFAAGPFREVLTTVLGASTQGATAVLVGTSAGGVAAFNVASWLLDTFDQVNPPQSQRLRRSPKCTDASQTFQKKKKNNVVYM